MNEQEIEAGLARLARSTESIGSPEALRRYMRSLEAGASKAKTAGPIGFGGPIRWRMPGLTGVRAAGSLAVTAIIAGILLVAVVPRGSSTLSLATPAPGPTFGASSWTKLSSFPALSIGYAGAMAMRQSDGLIYGLVMDGALERQSARWSSSSNQFSVAHSVDGRAWTVGGPLPDPVRDLDLPPMDSWSAYNDVVKRGTRWVVVGGLVGAPAEVAIGDGNQPVQSIGMAWVSDDGISWQQPSSARFAGYELYGVVSTGWGFVATGVRSDGKGFGIWTSSDGATWQAALLPAATAAQPIGAISFDPAGGYLVIARDGDASKGAQTLESFQSVDGHEWAEATVGMDAGVFVGDLSTSYENGNWTIDVIEGRPVGGITPDASPKWDARLEKFISSGGTIWTSVGTSAEFPYPPSLDYRVWVRHGSEIVGFGVAEPGYGSAQLAGPGATRDIPAATTWVGSGDTGTVLPTEGPVASPSGQVEQAVSMGRTVDLASWTPAGTGPSGTPIAAVATTDRLLVFVAQYDYTAGTEWVEVWSAPWP